MYISFIHTSCIENDDVYATVHPFYKDSFAALYDVPADCIENIDVSNNEWLLSAMGETLSALGRERMPDYFFDVRLTEDFSAPAPEYLLLHGLGLKTTNPLKVRGMGANSLIMALRLTELYLQKEEQALFCIAEQYNQYDAVKQDGAYAVSFIVSLSEGEYLIEDYGMCSSEEKLQAMMEQIEFDEVYTDESLINESVSSWNEASLLIRMFISIKQKASCHKFHALCICKYCDLISYIVIKKAEEDI